jgi:hypothetical protein
VPYIELHSRGAKGGGGGCGEVVAAKVVNETVTYAKVALGRRHELKLNRI